MDGTDALELSAAELLGRQQIAQRGRLPQGSTGL
jgi:hypothetical protein